MLKLQASLPSVHDAHCTCITLGTDGTLSVMAAAFENRRKGHRAFNEAQHSVPDFGRPLLMQDVGGGIFADRRIGFPIPDVASGDSVLSYLITSPSTPVLWFMHMCREQPADLLLKKSPL